MLRHVPIPAALGTFRICRLHRVQATRGHFQLKLRQMGVDHCEPLLVDDHTKRETQPIDGALWAAGPWTHASNGGG